MLSLALLDSIAVVERVKLEKPVGDSHYYYRMNPKFFPVVDEKDLVLPGTPGKFYSLYEQLCRDNQADLRRDLRNALIDLADSPAFSAATLHDEIQRAYRESRETLEGKEFNKMITGMLYRQQMAYFRGLLQMEWTTFSMQKALDLPVRFSASK
jgi:hypothetical protein